MTTQFTLEYWMDDNWYVGKLKEIPGIFSQGETLEELEDNIRDVYQMILEDEDEVESLHSEVKKKQIELEV
ncbi:MAG: type II toxin-antitoxin system HicB family antitoxin [Cytophagales bacterium]|nr:type II toxin-antitoxin system HicB family antitoxin [Cytophagales bacterium]